MQRSLQVVIVLVGFLATFIASPVLAQTVHARLEGFQEVPAVSTEARGDFRARLTNSSIIYELSYEGLEGPVRQAHIHFGQAGANGGVSVFLCQTVAFPDPTGFAPLCPQSGMVTGVITADNVIGPNGQGIAPNEFAELLDAIRSGVTYANVHSDKFGPGEIRGQIGSVNRRARNGRR